MKASKLVPAGKATLIYENKSFELPQPSRAEATKKKPSSEQPQDST